LKFGEDRDSFFSAKIPILTTPAGIGFTFFAAKYQNKAEADITAPRSKIGSELSIFS